MTNHMVFEERVQFREKLTKREIQALISNKALKVLQCSEPVKTRTWKLLNEQFFPKRPEVQLRVYGWYAQVCDLSFVTMLTNVRNFSADSLMHAQGVEHLSAMEKLESLGVGIFHLEGFDFLNQVPSRLKKLYLGETKSKKPDLSPLNRFHLLEEIYLVGQQKNIEVLSQLLKLKDVTLRSISTPEINYLRPLAKMWSLDIKLGGIKNLNGIEGMENIKYLELWQIRGLANIEVISTLTGLQHLFLQSLRQVERLPDLTKLKKLQRITMENMKGLIDIGALEAAPALEELIHTSAGNLQPEDYLPLFKNPNLKSAGVWFGSDKRNNRFKKLLEEHAVAPYDSRQFIFR
ncbi:MAG: hypothetical protein ABFS17_05480 [Chloroflexota bacterium]